MPKTRLGKWVKSCSLFQAVISALFLRGREVRLEATGASDRSLTAAGSGGAGVLVPGSLTGTSVTATFRVGEAEADTSTVSAVKADRTKGQSNLSVITCMITIDHSSVTMN
mgnify:CR=1 FL=1